LPQKNDFDLEQSFGIDRNSGIFSKLTTPQLLPHLQSHGATKENYYPRMGQPNIRAVQFLVAGGETLCHEKKGDLNQFVD